MEGVSDLRTFLLEEYCVGIIMNAKYDITSFKISRYQRGLFWSDFKNVCSLNCVKVKLPFQMAVIVNYIGPQYKSILHSCLLLVYLVEYALQRKQEY